MSFLSKNKLQKMEKVYQESKGDVKSQASKLDSISQVALSIAPSKAKTEMTRLSKIAENEENPTLLGEISK